MDIQSIPIDQLSIAGNNVRKAHTKTAIESMAKSIESIGLINPITVYKNGDGYKVIAGQLRYLGASAAGLKALQCNVVKLDDANLIDLSLQENVTRVQMEPVETYRAYHDLFTAGMEIETIAQRYDTTVRSVEQVLSIGGMDQKILDCAQGDDAFLDLNDLQLLATAGPKAQRRWLKKAKSKRPFGWPLKQWLYGDDGWWPTKAAIFDTDKYTGEIVKDIFGDDDFTFMVDGQQFWELQNEAVADLKKSLLESGWATVEITDYFSEWNYKKTNKADGGGVYITVNARNGDVNVHKGWSKPKRASTNKTVGTDGKVEKPNLSNAVNGFIYQTKLNHLRTWLKHLDSYALLNIVLYLIIRTPGNWNLWSTASCGVAAGKWRERAEASDDMQEIYGYQKAIEKTIGDGELGKPSADQTLDKLLSFQSNDSIEQVEDLLAAVLATNMQFDPRDHEAIDDLMTLAGIYELPASYITPELLAGITKKEYLLELAREAGVEVSDKATTKVIRQAILDRDNDTWVPAFFRV